MKKIISVIFIICLIMFTGCNNIFVESESEASNSENLTIKNVNIASTFLKNGIGKKCFGEYFSLSERTPTEIYEDGRVNVIYKIINWALPSLYMYVLVDEQGKVVLIQDDNGKYSSQEDFDRIFGTYKESCFFPKINRTQAIKIITNYVPNQEENSPYLIFRNRYNNRTYSGYAWVMSICPKIDYSKGPVPQRGCEDIEINPETGKLVYISPYIRNIS